MKNPEQMSKSVYYQIADQFEVSAIYHHNGRLIFRARPYRDPEQAVATVRKRLDSAGFEGRFKEDVHGMLISVKELPLARRIPRLNIILFFATLLTMFFAPVLLSLDFSYFRLPGAAAERLEFTVALMAILLFHEFGHYLAGRRRGVLMSLPYFIPAPNIVGTFGAIIKSRSPFANRRDLIEVGAAGPLAGFIISVIALSLGLQQTEVILTESGAGLTLGDSLLIRLLTWLFVGPIPEGYDYVLSPAAFAGWVGLLITMINLLPLGQLDGGHIVYGLIGRHQHRLSRLFFAAMIVLGFWWPGWWLFGVLVFLFGMRHPPTINDARVPSLAARLMGIAALIIFVISFVPVPFKM
ncbi:MAG: site-2 protease family protein [Candidatus Zixiibacteriota bacterium]|nr:MAG: site-2 protease family protein [candidate division Zixibacteria bacterium]